MQNLVSGYGQPDVSTIGALIMNLNTLKAQVAWVKIAAASSSAT